MELYLLRHGAAARSSPGQPDAHRALTPEGARAVRDILTRAANMGMRPEAILSSPYLRAMETAEIAAQVLGYAEPILQSRALEPDAAPPELWAQIRVHGSASVLVVSHEPLLSSAVAWVQGITKSLSPFPPGGLARVDIERVGAVPIGKVHWLPGAE